MRKTFAVFLVFSVLMLSGSLFAKEKKGASVEIQKKDGQLVQGELISVKENSLLILDSDSGADVTVFIRDISEIRVVKKSKVLLGGGVGFLIIIDFFKPGK